MRKDASKIRTTKAEFRCNLSVLVFVVGGFFFFPLNNNVSSCYFIFFFSVLLQGGLLFGIDLLK